MASDCPDLVGALRLVLDAITGWELRVAHEAALHPRPSASEQSLAAYERVYRRLEAERRRHGTSAATLAASHANRRTWTCYRASYRGAASARLHAYASEIAQHLSRLHGSPERRQSAPATPALLQLISNCCELLRSVYGFDAVDAKFGRLSPRRRSIEGLPCDWREQLADQLPEHVRLPYLVMAQCGCRPAELARGIQVETGRAAGQEVLTLRIPGAKVTSASGQPLRCLSWLVRKEALSGRLFAALEQHYGTIPDRFAATVAFAQTDIMSKLMRRRALRLWPHHRVSPYCLRYQFASDLREAGASRVTTAKALGHADTESQCAYRPRRRRLEGINPNHEVPYRVEATRPVLDRWRKSSLKLELKLERVLEPVLEPVLERKPVQLHAPAFERESMFAGQAPMVRERLPGWEPEFERTPERERVRERVPGY